MNNIDVTSISMPMAALIASLIGASATITASLINLSIAWKKQTKDQPASKKSKRGPVLAVWLLVAASAIGGFSLSQYLVTQSRKDAVELETQMREKLERLSLVAARLEQAVPATSPDAKLLTREKGPQAEADTQVVASVSLPKCTAGTEAASPECTEPQAQRVEVCAELHASAKVAEVQRFVREDGDARPWAELRVAPGQSPRNGAFVGDASERKSPHARMMCQAYVHWGGPRIVRLLVIEKPSAAADAPATGPLAGSARGVSSARVG